MNTYLLSIHTLLCLLIVPQTLYPMDFFTTVEPYITLEPSETTIHNHHKKITVTHVQKEIFENILYATIDEAAQYIESLCIHHTSEQYQECMNTLFEEFERFQEAYMHYKESCNQSTQSILRKSSICEITIKHMQQEGFALITNIINVLGLEYQFVNNENRNWLHYAIMWKNEKLVQWLINTSSETSSTPKEIYLNMRDDNGHTPLDEAILLGIIYEPIARIIRSNGGRHGKKIPTMMEIILHQWQE